MRIARLVHAFALAAVAANALAYNVIKNGDFTGGVGGWNTSSTGGGTSAHESCLGSPAGGSLRLQAYGGQTAHAEQCVDVHKWTAQDFVLRSPMTVGDRRAGR
jgi:hypothetical protein